MACGRKCSQFPSPLQSPESLPIPAWSITGVDHSADHVYVLRVVMTAIASMIGLLLILFVVLKFLGRCYFWRRYYHNRRRSINSPILFDIRGDPSDDDDDGPSIIHPIWFINTVGLQQSVIDSIAIFKYRKGDGLVEGSECSVCLGEFQEDEALRILPKCTHAFHVQCIDTWLRSRKNCPLCRAPVIRDETAVTVPEGGAHVENLDGGGSFEVVGGGESSISELRVEEEEEEEEDGGDDGIVAVEDEDCEVLDKNLGNCEKMMRVKRSVSVHSYDPPSNFEVPTQEQNSYSLHSF